MNRYEIKKQINSGAFGSVFEAVDKENDNKVAIKKVHKKFYELNQKKKNREVKALNALSHPNIITLMDFVQKGNGLYFVFELMDYNLYEVIANRRGAPFPLSLIQFILKETLIGLNYLHNSGFFHRDIKPENILVSGNKVKIADFGLVRELNSGSKRLSKYVSTSWYRAPEVFFGSQSYDSSIDLWALGAIASELMTLKPLFPGKNDNDQIFLMCNVLGSPTESFSLGGKWTLGIQLASIHDIRFPKVEEGSLKSILQAYTYYDTTCLQFIVSLLQYDPTLRLTAAEALDHPFFSFTCSNNNQNVDLSISYPYFPKEITQIDFSNHSLELPNINGNGTISPFINGFISSSEEDLEEEEIIINNEINQQIELEDNFNLSYSSDKLSDPHSIIYNTNNNESSTLSMCFDYPQNETSSFCSLNNLPNLNQNQNQSNNDQIDEEDTNNNHKPVPFYLQKKEFQLFAPPPKFYHNEMEIKRLSINSKRISNNSSNKRRASEIYFNFDKHNQTYDTFDITNNPTNYNYNRRHSLYDILDSSELATFPISLSNNEPKMVDNSTSPIKSPLRLKEYNKREKNHFRKPSKLVSGLRRMSNILSKEFINIKKGSGSGSGSGIYSNSNSSNNSNIRQHKRGLSLTIGNKEMSSSTTASSLSPNISGNHYKDNEFQQFIENTFSDIANDTTINRLSSSWDQFETHSDYLSMNNYNNYQYKTNLSLTNSQTTSRKNSNKKLNRKLSFKIKPMSPKSPNNNPALAFNLTSNYTKELDQNNNSNDKFFVTYSHPATPNKINLKNQLNLNHSYDSTSTTTNHNNKNTLGYKGSIKKENIKNDKKRKESINGLFSRIKLFFNSKKVS
ncbi:Pkinase-domain-containing protein [Neoconidiobolus thromboides FSU 785]|nr:Pkinase-domain-containing protein [Neoconidiobolus thromboides FSU 785]